MMRRWETAGIVGAAIAVVCCAALPLAATAVGALTAIALIGVVGAVVVVAVAIALALHLRARAPTRSTSRDRHPSRR